MTLQGKHFYFRTNISEVLRSAHTVCDRRSISLTFQIWVKSIQHEPFRNFYAQMTAIQREGGIPANENPPNGAISPAPSQPIRDFLPGVRKRTEREFSKRRERERTKSFSGNCNGKGSESSRSPQWMEIVTGIDIFFLLLNRVRLVSPAYFHRVCLFVRSFQDRYFEVIISHLKCIILLYLQTCVMNFLIAEYLKKY